jgi:hypothetical protein
MAFLDEVGFVVEVRVRFVVCALWWAGNWIFRGI